MMLLVLIATLCFWQAADAQQKCAMLSKGSSTSLRIMTYNIRYDNVADGQNQWPNRKVNVANLIRQRAPDLIGVQEALARQMADLQTALPTYRYYGVGRNDGKTKGEYSAIFYRPDRFDLLKNGTFWLSETPTNVGSKGWDAASVRICSWVQVLDRRTQLTFYLFNTHFDHFGVTARLESARLILTQIKTIAGSTSPVILTGDLNATPSSAAYRVIITNSILKNAKTVSESLHCGPNGTHSSFTVAKKMGNWIDYIFVSSQFKVLQHGALIDSNNGFYPSDHIPVLAEVVLNSKTSG